MQGDRIGLRQLETDSGQSKRTLEVWSRQDSWVDRRSQFQDRLRVKTEEKTIEKTSELLSDEFSGLAVEHFKAHNKFRRLVELVNDCRIQQIESATDPEELRAVVEKLNPIALNFWSLILDRHIKGERVATSMEYQDLDKAIAEVIKAGYKVVDPSDTKTTKTPKISSGD